MLELIKKAMYSGIGMALKTKTEVEAFAQDFVKKTELSEAEGKQFVDDFLKRYDESRDKLEEKIEKSVKEILGKTNVASRDELAEIKEEIKKLKASE